MKHYLLVHLCALISLCLTLPVSAQLQPDKPLQAAQKIYDPTLQQNPGWEPREVHQRGALSRMLVLQFTAVTQSVLAPSLPYTHASYMADGAFTITVADGDCVGTYSVYAEPVIASGPMGSTPPQTTVIAYLGFPNGNFFFANAGSGQYAVTVTEISGCGANDVNLVVTVPVVTASQFTGQINAILWPTLPLPNPNYTPNGYFEIIVNDGNNCPGTYSVHAQPVPGTGPAGTTPPTTSTTSYTDVAHGLYFFGDAGAGQYNVTITETAGCNPPSNPINISVLVPAPVGAAATVTSSSVAPSCPFGTGSYAANGSFTVNVVDGANCPGTYTVNAAPIAGSGPGGSTPALTTIVTYIGFPQGNFLFANAGAGQYTVAVTETSGCLPAVNPVIITVTVPNAVDVTPPTITCPANVTLNSTANTCNSMLNMAVPLVMDNCGVASVTNNFNGTADASGVYPIGTTMVIYTVTDDVGNTATCQFSVTVQDLIAPAITCPGTIHVNLGPGQCRAPANWVVTATDNCSSPGAPVVVQTQGPPSGTVFEGGTVTTITYMATDVAGNTSTCSFQVNVHDYSGPVLTSLACNDHIQISLDANCEGYVNTDLILEGGPYRCYDDYLVSVQNFGSGLGGVFINETAIGQTLGVTITDPVTGNRCWGVISVEDKLKPSIACTDVTLTCGESTAPVYIAPIAGTVVASASPGSAIGPNAGVVTTQNLSINAPANAHVTDVNITIDLDHTFSADLDVFLIGPDGTVVELATDVCGGNDDWDNVTFDDEAAVAVATACVAGPPTLSGSVQPEGSLADFDGLAATGTWILQITDDAGGDGGVLNSVSLSVSYFVSLPYAPQAADACSDVTLSYIDVLSGTMCSEQQINRTWTATDASGNKSTCVQIITIDPLTLDDLVCPANYIGTCGQSVDPNITGWPTANGTPIVPGGVCNLFVGYSDQPLADCGNGSKIIRRWTILDWCAGQVEECVQVIKLSDNEAPVLTCPANLTVGTDPWYCNRDVILSLPTAYDACGTAFTLTPTISSGILVHFSGNNYRADDLPLGVTTVTWKAIDACGNQSTCSYTITVVDNVPPVPLCDEHTVVALTTDDPLDRGLTKVPAKVFDDGSYDNCGPVTFLVRRMDSCIDFDWIGPNGEYPNNDGGLPEPIDQGLTFQPWVPFACCDVGHTIMVELRVVDQAGNTNSCMVEAIVQDKLPPFITCPPDITVSCDYWFDAHETNGFETVDGLEGIFGRVLDAYEYDDHDRQSIIINDPGNTSISQPHNWGRDGWTDDNCDVNVDVRTRLFNDCSGATLPGGGPAGAVRLVERTFRAQDGQGNTSTCRQRIWVVDFDPFYITDTQCGLNNADDVRWPCDLLLTDCPQGPLTPENLSAYAPNNRPQVNDDNCSLIGIAYDDKIFYFVDNACYKIVRTWTIIDWCQYDAVLHTGYWTYVQVIKVHDQVGPAFVNCPAGPLTYCVSDPNVELPANNQVFLGQNDPNSSACSVHVWESRTVHETCSDKVIYDVKIYPNNGSQYVQIVAKTTVAVDANGDAVLTWDTRQNSLPASHAIRKYGLPYNDKHCSNWPLPGGEKDYHRVLWSVEDGCGNTNTCEYLFRLEDCKKPSPVCVGLSSVVMPSNGSVTIWAKDFNASSYDDCTLSQDLLFSFSGTAYEPSHVFDCAALEANGSPSFLVQIWAADEGNDQNCNGFVQPLGIEWSERNKDYCTTFIVINDNLNVCDPGSSFSGTIETEQHDAIAQVQVGLINPSNNAQMAAYTTESSGEYHFTNPLIGYMIKPRRNDDHKNGVSTLDLVKIQKHLLGIQSLESPYKLIAADANNSQSVSVLDLVEIRKLILGLYTEFPKSESWRFVRKDFVFDDMTQPWPFEEAMVVDAMTDGHDFIGIKVGDVNGNATANATQVQTRNAHGVLEFRIADVAVESGTQVSVPVRASNFNDILGYQLTWNARGLILEDVLPGQLDVEPENIGIHPEAITMSWNTVQPKTAQGVLFTLVFSAVQPGLLSEMLTIDYKSRMTQAEAYDRSEGLMDIALNFEIENVVSQGFALYQNTPNPFNENTRIGFSVPTASYAVLSVFDASGKLVHSYDANYDAGYHEIELKARDFGNAGIYYYQLRAGDFTASKILVFSRD